MTDLKKKNEAKAETTPEDSITDIEAVEEEQNDIFMLIDGHALLYRAFHAFPSSLTTSDGELINAVYGFTRILLTVIRDFEPEYIAVAFDHPKPTFRHTEFADYKGHREEMPLELQPQVERVKEVVKTLNIPMFELEGFEADDLVGTVARRVEKDYADLTTLIVSGDKDLLQLVTDAIHVYIPKRGVYGQDIEYTPPRVKEKMGVRPDQIVDLKALMGDSSDNIPGVAGVGKKTATTLIQNFDTLDNLYAFLSKEHDKGEKKQAGITPSVEKKLTSDKDNAYLSQKLATIEVLVPLDFSLEDCEVRQYDKDKAIELFQDLDFKSLISLLPDDAFEGDVQQALF